MISKEDKANHIQDKIGFMDYMIGEYQKKIEDERSTNGGVGPWWGENDPKLAALNAVYKQHHAEKLRFLHNCIKECKKIKVDLQKEIKRLR